MGDPVTPPAGGDLPVGIPLNRRVVLLGVLASAGAVAVHSYPLLYPALLGDDFQILIRSWTWSATRQTLWEPANEHTMPLGRLTTWVLVRLASRPTALPLAAALQGPAAVMVGMWLLYAFVSRELGHPFYGLVSMVLFGVSTAYDQAVSWFAASFAILAVDTLLLALLAAQRWRQTGRGRYLLLSAVGAAAAPAWFASGILAGPLCTLYLLPSGGPGPSWAKIKWKAAVVRAALTLVPTAGSIVFLAVSLPRTAEHIMHLEHYGGKTAWQAIQPRVGLEYTSRSLVDNWVVGTLGVSDVVCPAWLVPDGLALLAVAGLWWWRRAPRRRLLLLGLGCTLASYLLVYSARADWEYQWMAAWTRYQLFPHLGLVLFLVGGLPRWQGRFHLRPTGELSRRQTIAIAAGIAVLIVCQVPRGVLMNTWRRALEPEQAAALRLIDEADARCRQHHISGDLARRALKREGRLDVPGSLGTEDGWSFVRGSDTPQTGLTVEEARRLLRP